MKLRMLNAFRIRWTFWRICSQNIRWFICNMDLLSY